VRKSIIGAISLLPLGGLLISSPASADFIEDTVEVNTFLTAGQSAYWVHDFTDDPAFDDIGTISSGNLSVYLWDDGDWLAEFALGVADSGEWAVGEVDTGTYVYGLNVSSLYDGLFAVTVTSLLGDFGIGDSLLRLEFTTAPRSVPEPATLSLLGAGLLAIGFASRRRRVQGRG
jgi:hypothetical protein